VRLGRATPEDERAGEAALSLEFSWGYEAGVSSSAPRADTGPELTFRVVREER